MYPLRWNLVKPVAFPVVVWQADYEQHVLKFWGYFTNTAFETVSLVNYRKETINLK